MSDELERMFAESASGIKSIRRKQELLVKKFSELGTFADISEDKIYVPGRGIVHSVNESLTVFDCGHLASPENYGGICEHGHVVCKDCLILCAFPGCFKRLCTVRGCSRKIVRGKAYCKFHGYTVLLFGMPGHLIGETDERKKEQS
ncbi:MAG: hypothetical protein V1762_02355 [Nitrospirota bacterium]